MGGGVAANGAKASGAQQPVRGTVERAFVLPNGIRLELHRYGDASVTDMELQQAIAGIMALPVADQLLVAKLGLPIALIPVAALEHTINGATGLTTTKAMIGATDFDVQGGTWRPTGIRIALRSADTIAGTPRDQVGEIVQHEIGHVVAVTQSGDRGEDVAERYASTY